MKEYAVCLIQRVALYHRSQLVLLMSLSVCGMIRTMAKDVTALWYCLPLIFCSCYWMGRLLGKMLTLGSNNFDPPWAKERKWLPVNSVTVYFCNKELVKSPFQQSLSFASSILAYSRKTLHELIKIFVENAFHVARIQLQTMRLVQWALLWTLVY